MDGRILKTIIEQFEGGPVGLSTIGAAVGEDPGTLEEVYEPFLMQQGFLARTSRGRCATAAAYRHFGYPPPPPPPPPRAHPPPLGVRLLRPPTLPSPLTPPPTT